MCAEPEKQFALVHRHILALQDKWEFRESEIVVMVERNLGLYAPPIYFFPQIQIPNPRSINSSKSVLESKIGSFVFGF